VTLTDAAVERYSRQILLPEVGGRGQERLCAARALLTGTGPAAEFAASLLVRAGVRVDRAAGERDTLSIALAGRDAVLARRHGTRALVLTLTGRPCLHCVGPSGPAPDDAASADPAADQVVGALAAGEAVRLALGLAPAGRVQRVDLAAACAEPAPLPSTAGCARCGGAA
jgi:molybdopterin/thiamine biosynthesis adenylyltransferase